MASAHHLPSRPRGTEPPTITAVIGAYNAERWISEAVTAVLEQTHRPTEVIVVNDGSTDGTARELALFGTDIRVVTQSNGGCPAAYNRGFVEASGDYVAKCDADDVWEPHKLERQVEALEQHPEIDIAFGTVRLFGRDGATQGFRRSPETGLIQGSSFLRTLYEANRLCASTALVRSALYRRLGPFVERAEGERFACDDYDYWLRALRAGAVLFYDPHALVRYRLHADNATNAKGWMYRSSYRMHCWHAEAVDDERLVSAVLANDLFHIARAQVDDGERQRARATFMAALRHKFSMHTLAFVIVLKLPERFVWKVVDRLVALRRAGARVAARISGLARRRSTAHAARGQAARSDGAGAQDHLVGSR